MFSSNDDPKEGLTEVDDDGAPKEEHWRYTCTVCGQAAQYVCRDRYHNPVPLGKLMGPCLCLCDSKDQECDITFIESEN